MLVVIVAILVIACVCALVLGIGCLLPKSYSVSRIVYFNRSREEIWGIVADFAGQAAWRTDVRTVERLPDMRGNQIWREIDQRGQVMIFEVIESVRTSRLVCQTLDDSIQFRRRWILDIAEYGEVTSFTIKEDGEVYNPVFRFVCRFIVGYTVTIDEFMTALGKRLGLDVYIDSA